MSCREEVVADLQKTIDGREERELDRHGIICVTKA